jgi:hypothetical protein
MNERLSAFSMFENYDAALDEASRTKVLAKLRTLEEVNAWQIDL